MYTESINTVSSASQQQLPKQDMMITFHVTPLWQCLDTATKYQRVSREPVSYCKKENVMNCLF